jgi:hypothetical protein
MMPAYTVPGPGTATGYTLASSGGSSGPDVSDLDWITIDLTDGSWTASDPGGVIGTSVSVASDVHTFNLNNVASGSEANNFSGGSTFTGPRWYAPLNRADGTRMTSDDTFTFICEIVVEAPTNKDAIQLGWGWCEDPTSTTLATIKKTGAVLGYDTSTSNARTTGMTTTGRAPSQALSGQEIVVAQTLLTASGYQGAVQYISIQSDGTRRTNGAQNLNQQLTASTDLFLIVLIGLNSNTTTITAPKDIKGKMRYRVVRYETPPS